MFTPANSFAHVASLSEVKSSISESDIDNVTSTSNSHVSASNDIKNSRNVEVFVESKTRLENRICSDKIALTSDVLTCAVQGSVSVESVAEISSFNDTVKVDVPVSKPDVPAKIEKKKSKSKKSISSLTTPVLTAVPNSIDSVPNLEEKVLKNEELYVEQLNNISNQIVFVTDFLVSVYEQLPAIDKFKKPVNGVIDFIRQFIFIIYLKLSVLFSLGFNNFMSKMFSSFTALCKQLWSNALETVSRFVGYHRTVFKTFYSDKQLLLCYSVVIFSPVLHSWLLSLGIFPTW